MIANQTHHRPVRIDSHHHLWRYTPEEFDWIDDSMAPLRRDFVLEDLAPLLHEANVRGSVVVQARQTIEESLWLLSIARHSHDLILGVVGWLPLAADNFHEVLEQHCSDPLLKGLRHVVQAEAQGFLDNPAFLRGMRLLQEHGLAYDILIYAHQLEEATRFVDRFPNQRFVLDHIGKPGIRAGAISAWSRSLQNLAKRGNVCCKISGMVTEADPRHWTADQLLPYFDIVLDAFGPKRLMVGTDWPVMTLGCSYAQWWQIVEQWIAPLTPAERAAIMAENAIRIYKLALANGVNQ